MDTTNQVSNGNAGTSKQQHHPSSNSSSGSATTANSAHGGSKVGECPEAGASGALQRQASNGRPAKQTTPSHSGLSLNLSNGTGCSASALSSANKNCLSNGVDQLKVYIKKEPDSLDSGGHRPCSRSPTTPTMGGRRLSLTGKEGKKPQRLPTSHKTTNDKLMRSFSMSDDLEDDLKLSAADCMGGVISTPPIKPLEEGDDPITTPSPPTSAGLLGSSKSGSSVGSRSGVTGENAASVTGTSTTTHSTLSSSNTTGQVTSHVTGQVTSPTNSQTELAKKPPSGNVNASLMQELHDFSKILDEVAMEQRANEERLTLNQPPADVFQGAQSHDIVATPHVARPTHLISPPPYYAATTQKPGSQQYYSHPPSQSVYAGTHQVPHGASSVQDPSLYIGVDYRQSLSHQLPHMAPAQVDPATFAPRPDQVHSDHLQRHTQLQHNAAGSPQVQQVPPLGQARSVLVSPPVQLTLPHTPISSHMPPFPDPAVSSVTTPTMPPPHTPTTPLEHFNTFPAPHQHPTPPSQIHSPTHPGYVPTQAAAGTVPISSTAFPYASHKVVQDQLRSPTVTSAGFNWQANSLRDKMLAQVNSQIEARIGGQKRLGQEAGFPIPQPSKMVAVAGSSPFPHPQIVGHNHMTLRPPTPQQQQQQYLPGAPPIAPPTGSGGPVGYTGLSQQQAGQLVHTISYQGQGPGVRLTSVAATYPHHHI